MRFLSIATFRIDRTARQREDRLSAVHHALRASGWAVQHLAITPVSPDAQASRHWLVPAGSPGDPDGAILDALLADPVSLASAARLLDDYAADIVWLERPWPWAFLRRYLADRTRTDFRIVYGAGDDDADDAAGLREDLLKRCDGIAVADRPALDILSKRHANARLFRNGTWPSPEVDSAKPAKTGRTCLYVGSGSARRADDLVAILGGCLSYLAPNERVVVTDDLYGELERSAVWGAHKALNLSRLAAFDAGSRDGLDAAVEAAAVVMLPFRSRADIGSDAARALFARKPIVATSEAMAAYAEFSDLPDIAIADDPALFRQTLLRFMRHPVPARPVGDARAARLRELLWDSTLSGLDPWLRQMPGAAGEALPAGASRAEARRPGAGDDRIVYDLRQIHGMLDEGWHPPEPEGAWSRRRTATLRLPKGEAGSGTLGVTLTVEAFTPLWRTLELDVFSDSVHYASCRFSRKRRLQSVGFTIDADRAGEDTDIVLSFRCSQIVSPLVARMGSDARSLGVRVRALSVTRQPRTV